MVLHTSGDVRRRREALVLLTRACERDSRNPQLHFQLAHMLVAADRLEDALDKLQLVRELAPREPPVFSLLGTVCHRLGQRGAAVGFFNTAVALDPKELAIMKAAYETFPVGDVNQEEEE
jgi:anaphase-promoting complex subunit 3